MPAGRECAGAHRMTKIRPTEDGEAFPREAQPIELEEVSNKDGQAKDVMNGSDRASPKKVPRIRTVEEGRSCLEKAQLIEPEDALDTDTLAGTLVQISFFLGMSQATRAAVHVVAFLMVQTKPVSIGDMATEGIVDWVVDRLADVIKSAMQATVAEIKSASTVLTESSTQMAATATSYRDALKSKGPVSNPIAAATMLDVRVRAREGVKSHQILVDAQTRGECILRGVSMPGLVEAANAVL